MLRAAKWCAKVIVPPSWVVCLRHLAQPAPSQTSICAKTLIFGQLNSICTNTFREVINVKTPCPTSTFSFVLREDINFPNEGGGLRHHICQFFYTSTFLNFWKFTRKKRVNRDILNLKYHILDVFIHLIGIISQFSYVHAHFTHHQWAKHGLMLPKTE